MAQPFKARVYITRTQGMADTLAGATPSDVSAGVMTEYAAAGYPVQLTGWNPHHILPNCASSGYKTATVLFIF